MSATVRATLSLDMVPQLRRHREYASLFAFLRARTPDTERHVVEARARDDVRVQKGLQRGRHELTGFLVASSGGHLMQLVLLARALPDVRWTWITFDTPDARYLLLGETTIFAHHPTNRNIPNLLRNLWLAIRVTRALRPAVIVTTGAGIAVPFCWIGRLFGARVIYIESLARTTTFSLSARLVHPVANHFFVQWPFLAGRLKKAEYAGSLLSVHDGEGGRT